MPLLRKDLKIGFLAGAVLLVLAVVYALVLTFSGSPEPSPLAQAPQPEALADSSTEELGDAAPVDEAPENASPIGPGGLARDAQSPTADWAAFGFNGNPPVVTETPTPGARTAELQVPEGSSDSTPQTPPADPGVTAADGMPSTRTHEVAAGETLSAIAEKYFGDPNLYPLIEKANPRLDARRMKVGQKLLIPDREAPPPGQAQQQAPAQSQAPAATGLTADGLYEVKPGDTLARISTRLFGREALWEEIYKLNQDLIGPDPARLKVGMKLKMPS